VEHLRALHDHLQTSSRDLQAFQYVLVAHRVQGVTLKCVNQMNVQLLVVTMLLDALVELP
jgi:hypothetical protein